MMTNALLCQQYLDLVYHDLSVEHTHPKNNISETYGEILFPSIYLLLSTLTLSDQDVFFDLGSGLGKAVLQIFLQSEVKEAYGIEIIPELHQQALIAAQRVQQDLPNFYMDERKLTFLLGSFLEIPLINASVVLIGSPCFSPDMLCQLGEIINNTASIHSVLSLRPLPSLTRLSFKKVVRVQCSWDTALCYIYN